MLLGHGFLFMYRIILAFFKLRQGWLVLVYIYIPQFFFFFFFFLQIWLFFYYYFILKRWYFGISYGRHVNCVYFFLSLFALPYYNCLKFVFFCCQRELNDKQCCDIEIQRRDWRAVGHGETDSNSTQLQIQRRRFVGVAQAMAGNQMKTLFYFLFSSHKRQHFQRKLRCIDTACNGNKIWLLWHSSSGGDDDGGDGVKENVG